MRKRKYRLLGIIFLSVGCISLGYAYYMQLANEKEEEEAARYSLDVVEELAVYLEDIDWEDSVSYDSLLEEDFQLLEVQIKGVDYIGTLEIPNLNIRLPIGSLLSDAGLKKTPCRFQGNMSSRNLIVGAHNYQTHFGQLDTLQEGDLVYITDVKGKIYQYQLEYIEIIQEDNVVELIQGNPNLTLFTCNYDNSQRIVARFKEI